MLIRSACAGPFEHPNDIMTRSFLKNSFNQEGIGYLLNDGNKKEGNRGEEEGHLRGSRTTQRWDEHLLAILPGGNGFGGGLCNLGLDGRLASWQENTALFWRSMWYSAYMKLCKTLAQVLTFLTIGWRLFSVEQLRLNVFQCPHTTGRSALSMCEFLAKRLGVVKKKLRLEPPLPLSSHLMLSCGFQWMCLDFVGSHSKAVWNSHIRTLSVIESSVYEKQPVPR